MFGGDAIDKKVKVLSGGEKTRLAMIKLLLEPVNLLILDEPTNHLDIRTKDILKQSIIDFTGTVIVVSHDREFLDGIVSKVYEFGGGKVKEHLCGIYEYLEMKRIDSLRELERSTDNKGSNAQTPKPLIATETSTEKASASKLSYMEQKERDKMLRKAQKQIADKETEIQNLEIELAEIEKVISAGGDIDQSIFQKYSDVQKQLETAMSYWELACQEYEELKNK